MRKRKTRPSSKRADADAPGWWIADEAARESALDVLEEAGGNRKAAARELDAILLNFRSYSFRPPPPTNLEVQSALEGLMAALRNAETHYRTLLAAVLTQISNPQRDWLVRAVMDEIIPDALGYTYINLDEEDLIGTGFEERAELIEAAIARIAPEGLQPGFNTARQNKSARDIDFVGLLAELWEAKTSREATSSRAKPYSRRTDDWEPYKGPFLRFVKWSHAAATGSEFDKTMDDRAVTTALLNYRKVHGLNRRVRVKDPSA